MTFATLLTTARKAAGKTQAQAAEHLGVDIDTIGNWEAGRSGPKPPQVMALASFYGTRASDWFATLEGATP